MDDTTLDELLRDDYRDDPVTHETRWGEGWSRDDWRAYFTDMGWGDARSDAMLDHVPYLVAGL